jgi:hypothetical protein
MSLSEIQARKGKSFGIATELYLFPVKSMSEVEIWTPRRFVRRTAWHLFDHLWEIEGRLI